MLCKLAYKNNKASGEIAACPNTEIKKKKKKERKKKNNYPPLESESKSICVYFIQKILCCGHQKMADI